MFDKQLPKKPFIVVVPTTGPIIDLPPKNDFCHS